MKGELGTRWTSTEPLSEINIVPMVDVFMVILLIFMITAPVISQTLDVQLPRASLSPGEVERCGSAASMAPARSPPALRRRW